MERKFMIFFLPFKRTLKKFFYNKVNQLYIYICSHISFLLHLPPSHPPYPTPLGGHKVKPNYLFYRQISPIIIQRSR